MTARSFSRALSDGRPSTSATGVFGVRDNGRACHRLDGRFDGLGVTRAAEERHERDGCDDRKRDECRDQATPAKGAPPLCTAVEAWV